VFLVLWYIQRYLSFPVSWHKCMYWATENPNVTEEQAVNIPGMSVLCSMSSRVLLGPFLFEATVTGTAYYFQCNGAPPHYHKDVRYLLDFISSRWMRRTGSVECPPWSPDITLLDGYIWGTLKNTVCHKTKNTAGPEAQNWNFLCFCSTSNNALVLVFILNVCDFVVTSITVG
jgi:hypothetical protein